MRTRVGAYVHVQPHLAASFNFFFLGVITILDAIFQLFSRLVILKERTDVRWVSDILFPIVPPSEWSPPVEQLQCIESVSPVAGRRFEQSLSRRVHANGIPRKELLPLTKCQSLRPSKYISGLVLAGSTPRGDTRKYLYE